MSPITAQSIPDVSPSRTRELTCDDLVVVCFTDQIEEVKSLLMEKEGIDKKQLR